MLDQLKQKNPALRWYSVHDAQFAKYGRIIEGIDTREIEAAAKNIAMPETGSRYVTSEPTFEALPIAKTIQNELFGGVDTELGYCWGSNNQLGATEWHTSSEINIAITDLVLLLATRFDIKNDTLCSEDFVAFFVPAGTVIEVYATTCHFCPCEVEKGGFGCVVGLPAKTNIVLDFEKKDPLLYKYNKWVLAHPDNKGMIANGAAVGIVGENYEIKY